MASTVLITGISSGFGKLAAELFARSGYKVHGTMRDVDGRNAPVAAALAALGVTVHEAELTDPGAALRVVGSLLADDGRIDVLINNAGTFAIGIAESFTPEDLRHIHDVNVLGPWRFIRAAMPHFRSQRQGLIITVASSLARFSPPLMTSYASAKHALEGLLEGMKYEVKGLGIDIAIIEPGIYPTRIFDAPVRGRDPSVAGGYGPLADLPIQILTNLDDLFASGNASNPQLIADAMLQLVKMPHGKRPLRTPVDPAAGTFTERTNAAQALEYANFLRASGMGDLLG